MITGYFTKVEVPAVQPGQDIKATVGFYALNPGAWYWKTFLIVSSPGLNLQKELVTTRETGQAGGRTATYNLGKMPDKEIAISFFLFAHDDAGYDWNWVEYQSWLSGFTTNVTHLESRYVFLSPAAAPLPDKKVLKFQILGEAYGGKINFDPQALDAEGHYYKGTVVTLKAVVYPGYVFVKWRGEVDNALSTSLINTVTMSENRLVKAEFALVEEEKFYPLEVDITPAAGGYVTTSPAPIDIPNRFTDGTVGKFSEGARVIVTAHPNPGYLFDHWSDEIQGGTSYNQTDWVSESMTEHKAVKCHFRESAAPTPPGPEPPAPPPGEPPAPPEDGIPKEWGFAVLFGLLAAVIFWPGPKKKGK